MNRPLRFLHVTIFYPPYNFGGDGLYVQRLARALAAEGHEVDVLHSIDAYRIFQPEPSAPQAAASDGVAVHGLRSPMKWLTTIAAHQTGRPLLQHRRIRRVFDEKPYDVIHFHNVSLFGPQILTMAPRLGSAVKIYTAHEHWLICPTHVLWKFGQRPCEAPECLRCTIRAKRPPQWWRYTPFLSRCTDHIDLFLSPSRFTAAMHAERGFGRPFEVLPLFVEIDESKEIAAARPHPAPYFLYIGRLESYKGVDRLIRAILACPGPDLLIVGTGSEEARLRAMANGQPRIHFMGSQPFVGNYLRHAIACCVPSLTFEVFGNVAIESLGRGTPVIAHDLGGLTEIIAESEGGILYRSDCELVEALRLLASDRQLRDAMGERGRRAYRQRWSREVHLRNYLGLIEQAGRRKRK